MAEQCPDCGEDGRPVPLGLVRHHLRRPWTADIEGRAFAFCEAPGCPVTYFASEGQVFRAEHLRQAPAYKTGDGSDLLCFCFDVTGLDVPGERDPSVYVRERVRKGECACDVLNPAGSCCLGSIGHWKKAHQPAGR